MDSLASDLADVPRASPTHCIDVVLHEGSAPNFTKAFEIVRENGGSTVGVGRRPNRLLDGKPICY